MAESGERCEGGAEASGDIYCDVILLKILRRVRWISIDINMTLLANATRQTSTVLFYCPYKIVLDVVFSLYLNAGEHGSSKWRPQRVRI